MILVLLVVGAILFAYLINHFMLKKAGEYAIIYGAPIMEELVKTLPAYYINRSVFLVHLLFGLGEAVYDFYGSKRKDEGKWAAIASIVSHSIFGGIAAIILLYNYNVIIALLLSMGVHCIWNHTIMKRGRKNT